MNTLRKLWLPTVIAGIGVLVMSLTLLRALLHGDLATEGRLLMSMPWGLMSMVDIYTGLLLFACWIFWRERYVSVASIWFLILLLFGNLASCLYILIAVLRSQGSIDRFIYGHRISRLVHPVPNIPDAQ